MPQRLLTDVVDKLRRAFPDGQRPTAAHVQAVIDGHPACVLVTDGHARIIAASQKALATLGHSLPSIKGLSVDEIAGDEEGDGTARLWEDFQRYRGQSGVFYLRRADNRSVKTRYAAAAQVLADLSVAVHIVDAPAA
jgi:PAS domain-containing protein